MGRKDKDGERKPREDAEQDGGQKSDDAGSHSFAASRAPGKSPGRSTLVARRYGPPHARKAVEAENAHMSVKASESPEAGASLASWQGKTFFHVSPDQEPRARLDGHRDRNRWQWSDPAGATLKVNSDATGKSGQLLAEWAPARARYMEVDIEPLASVSRRADVLHGHGPIELDPERITLEDAEHLAAGMDPSTRAAALMFFDSPAVDATYSDSAGENASAGTGTRGPGSGPSGASGREDAAGKDGAVGRRGGQEQGSEHPSWYRVDGAAIARQGGRTPTEHGEIGGSAGGERGGTGKIDGSGWIGVVDAPEEIAAAIAVGLIIADANVAGFGRGLFKRVVNGLTGEALERAIEKEARDVIARSLARKEQELGQIDAFARRSRGEQARILKNAEREMELEYYERLEKFARRQAEEYEAELIKLQRAGGIEAHHHELATRNAAAYREIEATCANKTGGTVTVRPDDAVAGKPYDPHTTRAELETEYPGEVVSSTVPATNKPNIKLRGQRHERSRMVHDQRGFPIFDDVAVYEHRLPREVWSVRSRLKHMRASTRELRRAIHAREVDGSIFSPKQMSAIEKGKDRIPGYVWHHHQEPGRMQLVPKSAHKDSSHIGGMKMWYGAAK
jgi:hypothetical protein